jgi:long-subunit acyl-CoA synthetase (AMP-forming)
MLDLSKYQSTGAALKDALDQFADEVCLIDVDREREKERLTYREFQNRAHPLAKALQEAGLTEGDRASIIMTNQSKWLISAYAIFFTGGVLVPLDYKLTPEEHWQLLRHSGASVLITEYPIWRQLSGVAGRAGAANVRLVLVAGRRRTSVVVKFFSTTSCHSSVSSFGSASSVDRTWNSATEQNVVSPTFVKLM